MTEVIQSDVFRRWLKGLRDRHAVIRILARVARLAEGNPGDVRPVGEGVSEMRIDHGPGYRVYYVRAGAILVVLLCGGDKASQSRDIDRAKALARQWKD